MKLSKLYTNEPEFFKPLNFSPGLNVVLAEIRLPQNKKRDTHNLGKTTLGRLIDFCLLSKKEKDFFLFKHLNKFENYIFFIEVLLFDGTFITIRRSVNNPSKISFKKHHQGKQDFSFTSDIAWDHLNIPFEPAKDLLDSILDLQTIKPWSYRTALGYLLRSQEKFNNVFNLNESQKHIFWKPYLAHIMGFNAELIKKLYLKEDELKENIKTEKTLRSELEFQSDNLSQIDGIILLKQNEIKEKQKFLDDFDFDTQDKEKITILVNDIDYRISELNSERYYLTKTKKKIELSLKEEQLNFSFSEAESLFKESGLLFKTKIKKDFEQLIAFNRAITDERKMYLFEEQQEIEKKLKKINIELTDLGKKRSETLSFLSETDVFNKYKKFSDELVILKADLDGFERQRKNLHKLQELRNKIRVISEEKKHLQILIEEDNEKQQVSNQDIHSLFTFIRLFFSEIINEVIDRKALLTVSINQQSHLDFGADILNPMGNATSEDRGHTYKKLLCIAFDMAIARAHAEDYFPHFIFHDGIFESLEDRKKINVLNVIREYSNNYGIQHIITLTDSDFPKGQDKNSLFENSEIILVLHDKNDSGKLFQMSSW